MDFPRKTCHVSIYMVPGDESFATQRPVKRILYSMTFHVSHWVVPGMDSLQHNSSCVSLVGSMK